MRTAVASNASLAIPVAAGLGIASRLSASDPQVRVTLTILLGGSTRVPLYASVRYS